MVRCHHKHMPQCRCQGGSEKGTQYVACVQTLSVDVNRQPHTQYRNKATTYTARNCSSESTLPDAGTELFRAAFGRIRTQTTRKQHGALAKRETRGRHRRHEQHSPADAGGPRAHCIWHLVIHDVGPGLPRRAHRELVGARLRNVVPTGQEEGREGRKTKCGQG